MIILNPVNILLYIYTFFMMHHYYPGSRCPRCKGVYQNKLLLFHKRDNNYYEKKCGLLQDWSYMNKLRAYYSEKKKLEPILTLFGENS